MSGLIPDDNYSPYGFITVLTIVFGVIFIVGPLLVPQGPDRGFIRICIMLTSLFMWLAWVTVYSSQVHPISALRFKHSTLVWISYSWGNVEGIKPIILPTTTPKPKHRRTTKKKAPKITAQPTTWDIPEELRSKTSRSTRSTTTTTTTTTTPTTTTTTTTTTTRPTTTRRTRTYTGQYTGYLFTHWNSYVMFSIKSISGSRGFLEFRVTLAKSKPANEVIGPRLLLTGAHMNTNYPMIEIAFHCGDSQGDLYIGTKDRQNRKILRFSKYFKVTYYRVEWNGAEITVYKLFPSLTSLFTWHNPDPFVIKYAGISGQDWNMRDLFFASLRYTFYKVTMEPISFSVFAELDHYRDFLILLSATELRSIPRTVIHIGVENGKECTISKNGLIQVHGKCNSDWQKNSYLPFYIWYKNGNIVVKSGYDGAENSKRMIQWYDPDPFAINFYGLRSSSNDEIPILVKNVEDDDWKRLRTLE